MKPIPMTAAGKVAPGNRRKPMGFRALALCAILILTGCGGGGGGVPTTTTNPPTDPTDPTVTPDALPPTDPPFALPQTAFTPRLLADEPLIAVFDDHADPWNTGLLQNHRLRDAVGDATYTRIDENGVSSQAPLKELFRLGAPDALPPDSTVTVVDEPSTILAYAFEMTEDEITGGGARDFSVAEMIDQTALGEPTEDAQRELREALRERFAGMLDTRLRVTFEPQNPADGSRFAFKINLGTPAETHGSEVARALLELRPNANVFIECNFGCGDLTVTDNYERAAAYNDWARGADGSGEVIRVVSNSWTNPQFCEPVFVLDDPDNSAGIFCEQSSRKLDLDLNAYFFDEDMLREDIVPIARFMRDNPETLVVFSGGNRPFIGSMPQLLPLIAPANLRRST